MALSTPRETAASAPGSRTTQMHPGRALVAMARPSQVLLIWAVFAAGVLLGLLRPGAALDPLAVLVGALLISGAAIAAHLVNEAEDAQTDQLTERTAFSGGSGALAASGLRPSAPLRLGLVVAGIVVAATVLAWMTQLLPGVAATLLLAGLAGALLYSLPPVAAMRHGWGEPLNALLGGLLLPLTGVAVVAGTVRAADVLAFGPFALIAFASVMATAWPDRAADAATGKATLQVRLHPTSLRRIHAGASVAAMAAMVVATVGGVAPLALAGLVVAPMLVLGMRSYTRQTSPLPNVAAMVGLTIVMVVANALGLLTGWSS